MKEDDTPRRGKGGGCWSDKRLEGGRVGVERGDKEGETMGGGAACHPNTALMLRRARNLTCTIQSLREYGIVTAPLPFYL